MFMKLKEFALWGFKLSLEDSRKFTLFNRSVCAHFERHFKTIDTENIYRVIVKLSDNDDRDGKIEESSSVLKYYKNFDFIGFYKLNELARKKVLLDTLFDSLIELCDMFDWSKSGFSEAYEIVVKENFFNNYNFKRKMNRNRKLVAEIICNHGPAKFDCNLLVKTKEGKELFTKLLFSEEPDEFLFNSLLGDIKWIDNETLAVLKKDRSEVERIQIQL